MSKASDNQFPKIILTEQGSTPSTPNANDQKLFIDSSDHHLKRVDENDSIVDIETGGVGNAGLYASYICIQGQHTQNTSAGTFTQGAWRTRVLNTEVADADNLASIASNQITLEAGTYRCYASCPGYGIRNHQAKLYNITDAADILVGTSEYSNFDYPSVTRSVIVGRFTIAAQKIIEVQHYCNTTKATNGLGIAANMNTEVYTSIELWKEA